MRSEQDRYVERHSSNEERCHKRSKRPGLLKDSPTFVYKGCDVCAVKGCGSWKKSPRAENPPWRERW